MLGVVAARTHINKWLPQMVFLNQRISVTSPLLAMVASPVN